MLDKENISLYTGIRWFSQLFQKGSALQDEDERLQNGTFGCGAAHGEAGITHAAVCIFARPPQSRRTLFVWKGGIEPPWNRFFNYPAEKK